MPETEIKDMRIYESGSWLSQNMQYFNNLEMLMKEMDSRRDSMPPGFNPKVIIQFMRGAVNEIKRVTALNQSLIQALKEAAPKTVEDESKK